MTVVSLRPAGLLGGSRRVAALLLAPCAFVACAGPHLAATPRSAAASKALPPPAAASGSATAGLPTAPRRATHAEGDPEPAESAASPPRAVPAAGASTSSEAPPTVRATDCKAKGGPLPKPELERARAAIAAVEGSVCVDTRSLREGLEACVDAEGTGLVEVTFEAPTFSACIVTVDSFSEAQTTLVSFQTFFGLEEDAGRFTAVTSHVEADARGARSLGKAVIGSCPEGEDRTERFLAVWPKLSPEAQAFLCR